MPIWPSNCKNTEREVGRRWVKIYVQKSKMRKLLGQETADEIAVVH